MSFGIIALLLSIYCVIRLGKLEEQVELLKKGQVVPQAIPAAPSNEINNPAPQMTIATAPVPVAGSDLVDPGPDIVSSFISWLRKDFLVKLGAFLLLIALGWFVSYAFANNWIGPIGRITAGLLLGAGFIVWGTLRSNVNQNQGGIFVVLGSGIVLLTVYAAREMYDLFTPVTALLLMFMSVVFVARVAVVHKMPSVAVSGLLLAAWAPFLTNSPEASAFMLFSYLTVVTVGSLWVLYLMQARILLLLNLAIVIGYSLPYISIRGEEATVALGFGFLFTAIFFMANTVSFVRHPGTVGWINYVVAVGTGLYLMTTVLETKALDEGWKSLIYIAWALVFAYGSFIVFKLFEDKKPFYVYGAISVVLLGVATASIFEGETLSIIYSLEVAALVILIAKVLGDRQVASYVSWLYAVPMFLAIESIDDGSWRGGSVLNEDSFVVLVLIGCLAASAYVLYDKFKKPSTHIQMMSILLSFTAALYMVVWVWLATHTVLPYETGTMVALFLYMVSGIALLVEGRSKHNSLLRIGGGVLIALVVGRLLMIEVWDMSVAGRIVIFTIIGMMLISTAFIKKLDKGENN